MSFNERNIKEKLMSSATRRDAFGLLVQEYSEMLYYKIRQIVITHDDTNDVLQNTFLKAWSSLDDFQYRSKLLTWLYRIAVNEALDHLRKNRMISLDAQTTSNLSVERIMSDDYFDGNEAQALLQSAISTLPDVQRTVFTMKYFNGMKYSEIGKILGTTEGSLKASYHVAVQKITAFLKQHA